MGSAFILHEYVITRAHGPAPRSAATSCALSQRIVGSCVPSIHATSAGVGFSNTLLYETFLGWKVRQVACCGARPAGSCLLCSDAPISSCYSPAHVTECAKKSAKRSNSLAWRATG